MENGAGPRVAVPARSTPSEALVRSRSRLPWRPLARGFLAVAAAVAGLWLGLVVAGRADVQVGPLETTMWLEPSLGGDSVVDVPPLGSVSVESHDGPLRLHVAIRAINLEAAEAIVADPRLLEGLEDRIAEDVRRGVVAAAVQGLLIGALGSGILTLLAVRSVRKAAVATGTAAAVLIASSATAVGTLDRQSVLEPSYTGLLTSAPALFGDAGTIVANFEDYRDGLASLVSRLTRFYEVTSTLPIYQPSDDVVRLLHISDLHVNPTLWPVLRSVVDQFEVDVVVDTGDLVHQGTAVENAYVDEISSLAVPYVFVRGNHDSAITEEAVAAEPNAVVLDRDVQPVAGLTFYGLGDPRFTPDKSVADLSLGEVRGVASAAAQTLEPDVPLDLVLMHDPRGAREFDGLAPVILCGHMHARARELLPRGSMLFQQGSTGASGPNALTNEEPTPITMTVMYFDSASGDLEAWDDITLGGLGLVSAKIERTLVESFAENADAPPPEEAETGGLGASPPGLARVRS